MAESLPCSPYQTTRDLVYFPRMLDKIRLHSTGQLPAAYHEFLGTNFDGRCLNLLGVTYEAVKQQVAAGHRDDDILEWCLANGRNPNAEEIEIWSGFMCKRGWRDDASERITFRLKEAGLESRDVEVATMFDFLDVDEGRTPPDLRKWEHPRLVSGMIQDPPAEA